MKRLEVTELFITIEDGYGVLNAQTKCGKLYVIAEYKDLENPPKFKEKIEPMKGIKTGHDFSKFVHSRPPPDTNPPQSRGKSV